MIEKATFAAGCFWGVEYCFRELAIKGIRCGYTGGEKNNPTYEDVCTGVTGHAEAVEILFEPSVTPYEDLLKCFWSIHDPTTLNRQGPDEGSQYRSAIFYHGQQQRLAAEDSRKLYQKYFQKPIVTEIVEAGEFYEAEKYHQNYFQKTGRMNCHLIRNKFS